MSAARLERKLWTSSRRINDDFRVYSWWRGRTLIYQVAIRDDQSLDWVNNTYPPIVQPDGRRFVPHKDAYQPPVWKGWD